MKKILSTLGFAVPTPNGIIPATTLPLQPKVLDGGTVENLPEPEDGFFSAGYTAVTVTCIFPKTQQPRAVGVFFAFTEKSSTFAP